MRDEGSMKKEFTLDVRPLLPAGGRTRFSMYGFPESLVGRFFSFEVSDNIIFLQEKKYGGHKKNGLSRIRKEDTRRTTPMCVVASEVLPLHGTWTFTFDMQDDIVKGYGYLLDEGVFQLPLRTRSRISRPTFWQRLRAVFS